MKYKVEWFDGKYPTCYNSNVLNDLLTAIARGYNGFARWESCTYFQVFPVATYEEENEELADRYKPIYTGYKAEPMRTIPSAVGIPLMRCLPGLSM